MEPSPNYIDVSVKGFFNKKISFKSEDTATSAFKVYNAVEAFFKNDSLMIDYKASDGSIYHLDRKELESFLGHRIYNDTNVALLILDHFKKDHPILSDVRDMKRIVSEKGREFRTRSDSRIRLYDNYSTYDNKGRVISHYNVDKLYLYTGDKLSYKVDDNWSYFHRNNSESVIIVNASDLKKWVNKTFLSMKDEFGVDLLREWAKSQGQDYKYFNDNFYSDPAYYLANAIFSDSKDSDVVVFEHILTKVESIVQFKKDKDVRIAEELKLKKIQEEQEAAKRKAQEVDDLQKINQANNGYMKVKDGVQTPQPVNNAAIEEVESYRSYELREGDVDYVLTKEDEEEKRKREELNKLYPKGETPREEKVEEAKERSPQRHAPSINKDEGPKDYKKPPGPQPKRH